MKTNKWFILLLLIPAIFFAGCDKNKDKNGDIEEKFCSYLDVENIDKTFPIVNEWLSVQSADLSGEQILEALAEWLKTQPCVIEVEVVCSACGETASPTGEIAISFEDDGVTKDFIFELSLTNPLEVTDYREYKEPVKTFCMYLDVENIDKTLPIVNEWLSAQSTDLSEEQILEALAEWLETQPCVFDAQVVCSSCEEAASPIGEIIVSFEDNGVIKDFIFELSMAKPLEVTGYREYNEFELILYSGSCFPEVSDRYVYPIVPGMVEWQQATSTDELYQFVQLPYDILESISTPGLIDALIHAPLFSAFWGISSDGSAIEWHRQYERFNSAKELFQREDAGNALVAFYELANFGCEPVLREYLKILGLEILFTKQEILDKMDQSKKKKAVAALLSKYENRPNHTHVIYPMLYLMYADNYEPIVEFSLNHAKEFQTLLDGYSFSYPDPVDLIVSFAKSFINTKKSQ